MQRDFIEFIGILQKNQVHFVIIGGLALAYYGFPRYTGDLDIWVYPDNINISKVFTSIEIFFDTTIDITPEQFLSSNNMITLGREPVQIQLHIRLDGVTTEEVWENRAEGNFGQLKVFYIGKEIFIKNKKTTGRSQDIVDIEKIEGK